MNYERIYYAIIEKAKSEKRSKKTAYYESHHIVPASFGGSNRVENKVLLTPREHFICHYLLMKIPRNEHWKYVKMCRAFAMMSTVKNDGQEARYAYARLYEVVKLRLYGDNGILRGENATFYGKTLSPEARAKVSKSQRENNSMTGKDVWNKGLTKDTDERVKKYGEASQGKIVVISEETKMTISQALKGKRKPPRTEEHKKNIIAGTKAGMAKLSPEWWAYNKACTSKACKGVPKKRVICPHCGKEGGEGGMIRWHFDMCKQRKAQ